MFPEEGRGFVSENTEVKRRPVHGKPYRNYFNRRQITTARRFTVIPPSILIPKSEPRDYASIRNKQMTSLRPNDYVIDQNDVVAVKPIKTGSSRRIYKKKLALLLP